MSPLVGGMLYNELVNLSGRIVTGFLAFRVAYGHKQAQNPQLEVSASSPERRTPARNTARATSAKPWVLVQEKDRLDHALAGAPPSRRRKIAPVH